MIQLSCRNVSLSYGGKTAVSGLTFEVSSGDYLCIVGENGAGKTTLVKTLLKLRDVTSGTITAGSCLSAYDVGYLPQQTEIQRNFPASVQEIVLSGTLGGSLFKPFYTKADKMLAERRMEELHVSDLKACCYRELSGGQQQRVLLARALCAAKKMLLLDEPVAGLDPVASKEMYAAIKRVNAGGMTIIMVSHDIAGALPYATHVLHIADHVQLFFGTAAEYAASSAGRRFLGDSCHD